MANRFLTSSIDQDVTDGSTVIVGASLSADNLIGDYPLKTYANKVIYSSKLLISDTSGLQAELDALAGGWERDGTTLQPINSGDSVGIDTINEDTTDSGVTIEGVLIKDSGITLTNAIDEFSIDGTLAGNSDTAVPTEKAVKTYVDNVASPGNTFIVAPTHGDYSTIQAALDANASSCLILVYPGTYTNDTIYFTANDQHVKGVTGDSGGITTISSDSRIIYKSNSFSRCSVSNLTITLISSTAERVIELDDGFFDMFDCVLNFTSTRIGFFFPIAIIGGCIVRISRCKFTSSDIGGTLSAIFLFDDNSSGIVDNNECIISNNYNLTIFSINTNGATIKIFNNSFIVDTTTSIVFINTANITVPRELTINNNDIKLTSSTITYINSNATGANIINLSYNSILMDGTTEKLINFSGSSNEIITSNFDTFKGNNEVIVYGTGTFNNINSTDTNKLKIGTASIEESSDDLVYTVNTGQNHKFYANTNLVLDVSESGCVFDKFTGVDSNIRVGPDNYGNGVVELNRAAQADGNSLFFSTALTKQWKIGATVSDDDLIFQKRTGGVPTIMKLDYTNEYVEADEINELTTNAGVTIEGVLLKDGDITIDTLSQSSQNQTFSNAGVIEGFAISKVGDGSVNVTGGTVYLRTTQSDTGVLRKFTVPLKNGIVVPVSSERYIYVNYNSGTPEIDITASGSTIKEDENQNIELFEVTRDTTTLVQTTEHKQFASNVDKRTQQYIYEKDGTSRVSGLIIGETGTRNLTTTAGIIWIKLNRISVLANDTSGSDTFSAFYNGTTEVTSQTQWDNLQYDNAGVLTAITNNRYGFHDVWMETDGDLILIYGNVDSITQAGAEGAPVITNLPDRLGDHASYIGRIIFQKSAATLSKITSAFDQILNVQQITDHGILSGLGDDDHTQYFNQTRLGDGTATSIQMSTGTSINEFSIDGTLGGNSDDAVPTEKAVKTYVDGYEHGNLVGLGDDDHSQYLLLAGRAASDTTINVPTGQLIEFEYNSNPIATIDSTSLNVDIINEYNSTNGVTIESVFLNNGTITITDPADSGALKILGDTNGNSDIIFNKDAAADFSRLYFKEGASSLRYTLGHDNSDEFYLKNTTGTVMYINQSEDVFFPYTRGKTVDATNSTLIIDQYGEIGTVSSLTAHKMNIEKLDSNWIYKLKPVSFNYKKREKYGKSMVRRLNKPEGPRQYGLLAEDVEKINKEICHYSKDGKLEGVAYRQLTCCLLNEIIKTKKQKKKLRTEFKDLKLQFNVLKSRLDLLENRKPTLIYK